MEKKLLYVGGLPTQGLTKNEYQYILRKIWKIVTAMTGEEYSLIDLSDCEEEDFENNIGVESHWFELYAFDGNCTLVENSIPRDAEIEDKTKLKYLERFNRLLVADFAVTTCVELNELDFGIERQFVHTIGIPNINLSYDQLKLIYPKDYFEKEEVDTYE